MTGEGGRYCFFHAAYSILVALKGVYDEKDCCFITDGVGAGGVRKKNSNLYCR